MNSFLCQLELPEYTLNVLRNMITPEIGSDHCPWCDLEDSINFDDKEVPYTTVWKYLPGLDDHNTTCKFCWIMSGRHLNSFALRLQPCPCDVDGEVRPYMNTKLRWRIQRVLENYRYTSR